MELTQEFLWVDCLNNLDDLAEDRETLLKSARESVFRFNAAELRQGVENHGSVSTRRLVHGWFNA